MYAWELQQKCAIITLLRFFEYKHQTVCKFSLLKKLSIKYLFMVLWLFMKCHFNCQTPLDPPLKLLRLNFIKNVMKTSYWQVVGARFLLLVTDFAAQLRQPKENSLVLCHLKTLRLYTGLFEFEFDHYLTNE